MFWTPCYVFAFNFLVCLYVLPKEEFGLKKPLGYASSLCLASAGHNPDLCRYCVVCWRLTSFTQFCWTNDTQTGLLSCNRSFLNPQMLSLPFFVSSFFSAKRKLPSPHPPTHSVEFVNFIYVFKKWDVDASTGLIWIRIETVGGVLWVR
jgi:hypothetical protein